VQALTRPSVATFECLLREPNATPRRAYTWIAVTALVAYLLSWLLSAIWVGSLGGGTLAENLEGVALHSVCGAAVAPVAAVLGFIISVGLTHAVAGVLGGTGTYSELAYSYAAYQAPLALITAVLSASPYLSYLSYAISLYLIILNVLAVKAVHGFGTGKAIVCALVLPAMALGAIIACLSIALSAVSLGT
jgi:hypothetical protein